MTAKQAWVRLPFLPIAAGALAGILVADLTPLPHVGFALAVVTVGIALSRRDVTTRCVAIACCFFALHSWRQTSSPGVQLARELGAEPQAITAIGVVVGEPNFSAGGMASFPLRLEMITRADRTEPSRATVQAYWRGDPQLGDRVQLFGVAEPIRGPTNPAEFSMRRYLARRGIYHSLVTRYAENGKILARATGSRIMRAAQSSRRWMEAALGRGLEQSPEVHGLINAMVLGQRDDTPDEVIEQFQQTGTLHLFSVSGLHVGIVAYLLWAAATALRVPRRWAAAVVIPALFFYAALTGLNTASVRAATMAALVLGGFFVERKVQPLNTLAAAAVIILLVDTNELFSIGFQLSFAVVLAIILLAGRILQMLVRWMEPDPFLPRSLLSRAQRLSLGTWRIISTSASVSLAAWIGSLLLILPYFYLVTPISLVANLIVVPIAFCVLAVGLISIGLSTISPSLALVFNQANWSFASAILAVVGLLARAPASHYYVELPRWPSGARAEITVLDVGAGAAIHLRTRRQDWLFDAGPERSFPRIVRSYLRSRGINRLDGLVVTHADSQHVGGAPALLRAFRPRRICDVPTPGRSSTHQAFVDLVAANPQTRDILTAPAERLISRNVTARVSFPPQGHSARIADDQALVMQLIVDGRWRVLLMSDSGLATEKLLLDSNADLKSDILIKGQHLSGVSGSPEFLERVAPALIIATSPDFPEQERVKPEWQALVEQRGMKLMRQDRAGAVTLRFYRGRWEARAYVSGESFTPTTQ